MKISNEPFKSKKIYLVVDICLILISLIFIMLGLITKNREMFVIALIFSFILNIKNCLGDIVNYLIYFVFLIGLFLFLIAKPIINIFKLENIRSFDYDSFSVIIICLILSLISLYIGSRLHFKYNKEIFVKREFNIPRLRVSSIIVMIISGIPVFINNLEKITFIYSRTYVDYYTSFVTRMPMILIILQQFFLPSIFLYLATFPKNKNCYIVLMCYIASNIASFIVGMRSPLMLSIVFSITYMFVKSYWIENNKKSIFTIKRILILLCVVPILSAILMSHNYIRQDKKVPVENLSNPVISFLEQQGNTFIILCQGKKNMTNIKENRFPGYTFGPIYDSIKYNTFSRILFGTENIQGQTENALKYGNDMRAHLSYALLHDKYFQGYGVGSSYLLELYYDFGYLGIVIYSIILGYILMRLKIYIKEKSIIATVILFFILSNLAYIPRTNASLVFSFLFNIYNIFAYIIIFIVYKMLASTATKCII